jgi:nanoRNase/pAp phosphatase (c-di-AMP/oligoRNAs hydrolase)
MIISFNLKGTVSESMKCVKILTRIEHPDEILKQKSSRGKLIWKKYQHYNKEYESIKNDIKSKEDILLVHVYQDNKTSYTKEMSNELLYRHPEKIIVLGREKSGEIKISLRSASKPLAPALKKALEGIEGYGGGHLLACGANIKKDDFDRFLENLRVELNKN